MPTAIITNGRVRWTRPPRYVRVAAQFGGMTPAALQELEDAEKEAAERYPLPAVVQASHGFVDDGQLRYRVIQNLNRNEGWVTSDVLIRWYGIKFVTVVKWVKAGWLDCCTEPGSSLRYYRVLRPEKLK